MEMAEDKIKGIKDLEMPNSFSEVQSFLGCAEFYRQFIRDFSRNCRPLTKSTKGDEKDWKWITEKDVKFEGLQERFILAPILVRFDLRKPSGLKTDGCEFALGVSMSLKDNDRILHPVAFHS
jgi:hypothetical protein